MTEQEPIIRFVDVSKVYPLPAGDVVALDHVSLDVPAGEFLAIMGPSGSGKSTLLNLMGCLDTPSSGTLSIKGKEIGKLSDDELTALRRDHIGFIFQQFNLIPLLNVLENVEFPRLLKERKGGAARRAGTSSALSALRTNSSPTPRPNSRADSSSGWRSPAPSSTTPRSSLRTNRRETSTQRPGPGSWNSSRR